MRVRGLTPRPDDPDDMLRCHCGESCSSGACCCFMKTEAPDLACHPVEHTTTTSQKLKEMLSDSMAPEYVRSTVGIQQRDELFQDYPHASEHQLPMSINSQANIESSVGGDNRDGQNFASFSGASSFESSAGLWRLLQAAATLEPPEEIGNLMKPDIKSPPVIEQEGKQCTKCQKWLPLTDFCTNKRSADGRYTRCRSCIADQDRERRAQFKKRESVQMNDKVCTHCHVMKSPSEFYKDPSRQDGLQSYCKSCFSKTYKRRRNS